MVFLPHFSGGFLGALFNHINYKLTIFRNKFVHSRFARVVEALIVAAVSGTVSFLVIFLYNDCQPMRAEPTSYPVQVNLHLLISNGFNIWFDIISTLHSQFELCFKQILYHGKSSTSCGMFFCLFPLQILSLFSFFAVLLSRWPVQCYSRSVLPNARGKCKATIPGPWG